MSEPVRTSSGSKQSISKYPGPLLQRTCACGQHTGGGQCEECKKKGMLQRQSNGGRGPAIAPPIVHEVLRSPGQPLDAVTRAHFEPRIGQNLSEVRVHTDAKAAESARAVSALAYTVGPNLVFGAAQFAPRTHEGQKLIAHELTHSVQQRGAGVTSTPLPIAPANDSAEHEADKTASRITAQAPPPAAHATSPVRVMRKLVVDRPEEMILNPDGQGLRQTNAQTVQQYLRTLANGSEVAVDGRGEVKVPAAFCPGFIGGLVEGGRQGYRAGSGLVGNIPILGQIVGGIGALLGGIVGAFRGLFGSSSPSRAASSSTPTGSTCLCDFVKSNDVWTIEISDSKPCQGHEGPCPPHTESGRRVVSVSPNSPRIWGAATASGKLETVDPWLVLGHELCGHAWLDLHNQEEHPKGTPPSALRNPETGKCEVASNRPLSGADTTETHERTTERENLLRREHGLEARGYRLRDPYCGEAFWREKGVGTEHWMDLGQGTGFDTYLAECECLRSQLPENRDGKYKIDQRIPEQSATQGGE